MCIPGMTSDIVDQIIANRVLDPVNETQDQHYEIWPYTRGSCPADHEEVAALYLCRRERLSGPSARLFRQRRPNRPAGSHARLYPTPDEAIILERCESVARGFPVEPIEQASPTSTN